ncbi:DUF952 domain-containing protein [Shewanella baltica]|uniref:DUF952 domain-containing protein n=1 Tax=Shewanella baltica TaxID=62322 RepID=UPI0001588106|nr:DUF952 domain-containing protein [Shewanella baltica]ABS08131.1 protein of unknown function DUF952 [Shewanella baltica OS185]
MNHLYRVVPKEDWVEAERCGRVPRCQADKRRGRVHLNELKDVELVANRWFSVEEEPVVLEIDVSGVAEYLKWEERTEEPLGIWPNLYVECVLVENVVRVFALDSVPEDKSAVSFRIGKALSKESVF